LQEKLAHDESTDNVDLLIVDSIEEEDSITLLNLGAQLNRQGSTTSIQTFGELGTGSPSDSLPGSPAITSNQSISNQNSAFKKCNSLSKDVVQCR
jgi:proline dehydrogenase